MRPLERYKKYDLESLHWLTKFFEDEHHLFPSIEDVVEKKVYHKMCSNKVVYDPSDHNSENPGKKWHEP